MPAKPPKPHQLTKEELADTKSQMLALLSTPDKFGLILSKAKEWAEDQLDTIIQRMGCKYEYVFEISEDIANEYNAVVLSDIAPKIIVSERFVFDQFLRGTTYTFRTVLRKCLDNLKVVRVSLRKPVPYADAIAYRRDTEKFVKGDREDFIRWISPRYFTYSIIHSVTATDTLSGITFTASHENLHTAQHEATTRLQRLVAAHEKALELYDNQIRVDNLEPVKPKEVQINLESAGRVVERRIYDSDVNQRTA